jgi:plasmid stabilization system protein ParE
MPTIRKSADLRNAYGEISEFCHKYREPVFITKNYRLFYIIEEKEINIVRFLYGHRDWINILKIQV